MSVSPPHQRSAEQPRVVITSVGAITPLGCSADAFWEGLRAGRSGIGPMTLCDPSAYVCQVAGQANDFDPKDHFEVKDARRLSRFMQIGVAAAKEAIAASTLDLENLDTTRVGVYIGNGNGGFPTIDQEMRVLIRKGGNRMSPFFFPMILPNMAASQISLRFGLRGYSSTVCTACAAGTQAIGEAAEVIRRGAADVMVTGGVEAGISEMGLAGFVAMRAMTSRNDPPERASRPFDADRDGFVPAEGAGILVLESLDHALRRGARPLAEVLGFGVSADAYHLVAPDPEGEGAARAMQWAIEDAGLTPSQIDYINAHGTSTPLNDRIETAAIKRVFGEDAYRIPISSTKSMIGHSLGAAGGLEAVACVKSLQDQVIHPTINYDTPDPECDLDYVPNEARPAELHYILSNSFGFGGQNACLVLGRYAE
ncbi:MAG TPA: beta-ketoacyl-ACP synthase II [Dehalococcoidia bacterium]|nr:beta-ketoacyl-ACP synthase II [Dehalococcoidia bacterium]